MEGMGKATGRRNKIMDKTGFLLKYTVPPLKSVLCFPQALVMEKARADKENTKAKHKNRNRVLEKGSAKSVCSSKYLVVSKGEFQEEDADESKSSCFKISWVLRREL